MPVRKQAEAGKRDGHEGHGGPVTDASSTRHDFHDAVNMTAEKLRKWLESRESHTVGAKNGVTGTSTGGAESVGHRSGRRIVRLLSKAPDELTDGDYAHMRKVIGYVRRHLAQQPKAEAIETSRWRYSLMNWGHDPLSHK